MPAQQLFEEKSGKYVTRQRLLCPNCITYHWLTLPAPKSFRCPNCRTTIPTDLSFKIDEIGYDVSFFGWFYGIVEPRERELARKEGRSERRFRLETPLEVLQLLGMWVAAGVVGGLGYDLIKAGALRIYAKFKPKQTPRRDLSGQIITPAQALRDLRELVRLAADYMKAEDTDLRRSGPTTRTFNLVVKADQKYGFLKKLTGLTVELQGMSREHSSSLRQVKPRKRIKPRKFVPLGATSIRTSGAKKTTKGRRRRRK